MFGMNFMLHTHDLSLPFNHVQAEAIVLILISSVSFFFFPTSSSLFPSATWEFFASLCYPFELVVVSGGPPEPPLPPPNTPVVETTTIEGSIKTPDPPLPPHTIHKTVEGLLTLAPP